MTGSDEADALFFHLIYSHLAAGLPTGPMGDAQWAKATEIIAQFRGKLSLHANTGHGVSGDNDATQSHLKLIRVRPAEATALDMVLSMLLGRSANTAAVTEASMSHGTAGAHAHGDAARPSPPSPLAWLCDENETQNLFFRIVDTVWPPHSPDVVGAV